MVGNLRARHSNWQVRRKPAAALIPRKRDPELPAQFGDGRAIQASLCRLLLNSAATAKITVEVAQIFEVVDSKLWWKMQA